jgi:hypothetical protein
VEQEPVDIQIARQTGAGNCVGFFWVVIELINIQAEFPLHKRNSVCRSGTRHKVNWEIKADRFLQAFFILFKWLYQFMMQMWMRRRRFLLVAWMKN